MSGTEAGYLVPLRRHRTEESIRGSRFITTLARARDEGGARSVIAAVAEEFPDATHNCWAFVAGPAGDTARIGLSDDGEPHGTAGRPILETLLHSEVGEVVAVVTRYYGGTKLGRGGLGRAYSGGVATALDTLPVERLVPRTRLRIEVDYAAFDILSRFLESVDARREEEEYGASVKLVVAVPDRAVSRLEALVAETTSGAGSVRPVD
ncbi:MAG: YigZ family protein [Gemmatimonadota bacterium]